MNGIDILNKEEILTSPEWIGVAVSISAVMVIISIIFVVAFTLTIHDTASILSMVLFVCSIIASIVFAAINDTYKSEPTGRYRYEVTIDDSVSITEVYDHYNVVEQRGDIWILEDKEDWYLCTTSIKEKS